MMYQLHMYTLNYIDHNDTQMAPRCCLPQWLRIFLSDPGTGRAHRCSGSHHASTGGVVWSEVCWKMLERSTIWRKMLGRLRFLGPRLWVPWNIMKQSWHIMNAEQSANFNEDMWRLHQKARRTRPSQRKCHIKSVPRDSASKCPGIGVFEMVFVDVLLLIWWFCLL